MIAGHAGGMITRRFFVAAPVLAMRPDPPILRLEPGAPGLGAPEAALLLPGGDVFVCPGLRARVMAVLRLRAMEVVALGFGADLPGCTQDHMALVGADGVLLALERMMWRDQQGASLNTRLAMLPDRIHITLQRDAGRKDVQWRRESWTDYLRLEGGMMRNVPPRPVLAGTWQAFNTEQRAATAAAIGARCRVLTPAMLAALPGSPFPEGPAGDAGQKS